MHIYAHAHKRRFIIGIDSWWWRPRCSHNLRSTVCKLEHQENQWYSSVQVQRPKNRVTDGISPGLSSKAQEPGCQCLRAGEKSMSQLEQRKFALSPSFCSISWLGDAHIGERDLLLSVIQVLISSETLSQTHLEIVCYQPSGKSSAHKADM